jgi:hypothetical protein
MPLRPAEELLYESEATLRLLDRVLDELQVREPEPARVGRRSPGMCLAQLDPAAPAALLERTQREILEALGAIERSRAFADPVRSRPPADGERSGSESPAAADLLEGFDRTLAMIDRIETAEPEQVDLETAFAELRDELFAMMSTLQFQDVTARQLGHASGVLVDTESRLRRLARMLDPQVAG